MIRYLRSYEGEIFISKRLRRSPRPPAGMPVTAWGLYHAHHTRFGTSPRRSRILIDEASVKERLEGLLSHGLKLNFHRYIGERKETF